MTPTEKSQLRVKSSGSAEPALSHVATAFTAATGQRVQVCYSADIQDYDVLLASRDAIERKFRTAGKVEGQGIIVGKTRLGIAVRTDCPWSVVKTLPEFRDALLALDRIVLTSNHTSGLYMEDVFLKIGLFDGLTQKIEHAANGPKLMDRLVAGTGNEAGFLSANAIQTYAGRGIELAGYLPDEIQLSREFMVVPATRSANRQSAEAFVSFCGGPGKEIFETHGLG